MVKQTTKRFLCKLAENKCEVCKKEFHEADLEAHRIRRGSAGGDYHWRNVMIVCSSCHKLIHSGEFR